MINAYDQTLLNKARTTLAWMFDYAVYVQEINLQEFYHMFLASSVSEKFETGDSSTVAGKSGVELAYQVLLDNDRPIEFKPQIFTLERTPEYWVGWALAYYQWLKNIRFRQITEAVPIEDILLMYQKYHEMDISQFVIEIERRTELAYPESALKRFREYANLSQSALAKKSGVPLRTIQQYEQRQKNINHAKVETVIQLAQALYCAPKDLLE